MPAALPFRKMNGLGNEIVVVDLRGRKDAISPAVARAVAGRPAVAVRPDDGAARSSLRRHRGLRTHLECRRIGGGGVRQRHALRGLGRGGRDRPQGAEVRDQGRRARRQRDRHGAHHGRHGDAEVRLEGHPAGRAVPRHEGHRAADRPDRQADPAFALGRQRRQSARRVLGRRRERLRPRPHRADAREPPDLPGAGQHLAGARHLAEPRSRCAPGSAAPASPRPAAAPPAPPRCARRARG